MEPIKASEKKSLKQTVIEELKQYIIDHQLVAGDKLPTERTFTELFGVSRSVVREALSYLENVGILRIRQGQGAFLRESNVEKLMESFFFLWQINNSNIREFLGLRVIFECSAVDEIIAHGNKEAITKLHQIITEMEDSQDIHQWQEADMKFHQQLLEATNNVLFTQMTNVITNYFFQAKHIQLNKDEYAPLIQEHKEIVNALEKEDAMKAKTILTKHINQAKA